MPTYREAVHAAAKQLLEMNLPQETAQLYMLELSEKESYDLYLHYEEEMPESLYKGYLAGIERICQDEPMQYVLGFSWFYGYRFLVGPEVLIPRPETEELVANILAAADERFSSLDKIEACDIGTGSGAIALTLLKEEPKFHMTATDISEEAVEMAKKNAAQLGVDCDFAVGDMLQPIIDKGIQLDILISNPPYIPSEEALEASVKDYEPHVALFGGEDGLKYYRDVFRNAKKVLKPKSMMAFEIGYQQKQALLDEVKKTFGEAEAEVVQDINGKDRMLFVYFDE